MTTIKPNIIIKNDEVAVLNRKDIFALNNKLNSHSIQLLYLLELM